MYLDTDDLVTSSIIAFLIAIVVFVLSVKAFRWLSPENYVADKGLSSHVWVEKPSYILSVSINTINLGRGIFPIGMRFLKINY